MNRKNINGGNQSTQISNKNNKNSTAAPTNRIIVINQIEIKRGTNTTVDNRDILINRNLNTIPATITLDNRLLTDTKGGSSGGGVGSNCANTILQCLTAQQSQSNITNNSSDNNPSITIHAAPPNTLNTFNNKIQQTLNENRNNDAKTFTQLKNELNSNRKSIIEALSVINADTTDAMLTTGTINTPTGIAPTASILKAINPAVISATIQAAPQLLPAASINSGSDNGNAAVNEKIISNGREARNRAEKQRRDKLNGSIAELATMVPHVAESPRRVDKTAILRYAAHGFRFRYVYGKTMEKNSGPEATSGMMITESLTKLLDGFLITITLRGQIVLITSSVEQHLGHCQPDLLGLNILQITHPDDHQMLKQQLMPTDLDRLLDIQDDENGEPRPRTQEEEDEIDRKLSADKRNFTVRLARATPRSEPTQYEIVKIDGCFRRADLTPRGVRASTLPTGLPLIRRSRGRDDSIPLHSISGNDIVLVALARIIKPPKIIDKLREANHFEYRTRHLIDGRMIMVDQRISLVAGYMTDEVTGLSPFTFMHQDDVRWVIVALRQMYDSNSSYGESCYRLLTRTGRFIYLRTRGFLEIDKGTNQVHSFLCINTLVSEEEGRQRCQDMKNKFSIIINANIPPSNTDGLAVDNPQQLEKAVIYLIENLQKTAREVVEADDEYEGEQKITTSNNAVPSLPGCETNESSNKVNTERLTKSPPLTLIPPNTSSIKSSISKSVSIVNTTAARNFRISRAKNRSISEHSGGNIKEDISSQGEDSNSSNNSNNNSIFSYTNDVIVKDENHEHSDDQQQESQQPQQQQQQQQQQHIQYEQQQQPQRSFSNLQPTYENISQDNTKSQNDNSLSNILIKTESTEYYSDNDNTFDNNRVPPLPNNSGYYSMQLQNIQQTNKMNNYNSGNIALSNTDIVGGSSGSGIGGGVPNTGGNSTFIMMSSTTEYKIQPISPGSNEQQKQNELKRVRNSAYEDITSDSCDSPTRKRLALSSNSPIGLDNISTSSLDNDQVFINATTVQTVSNPQEEQLSQLLPSSFSQIKNSLSHIKTATTELKRQCIAYADSKNQLAEIIDERDKQEELLENIQNEYEAHLLQHQKLTSATTLPITNVSITNANNLKNSATSSTSNNTVDNLTATVDLNFDTDDILQRNINLTKNS